MDSIYSKLSQDALEDGYLNELIFKLTEINFKTIFKESDVEVLTQLEISHLYRFADIMSCSEESEFRNISLKIVSLMYEKSKEDEQYNKFALAVLTKLGSFYSIQQFLNQKFNFNLPTERNIESQIKKEIQIVPFNEKYIFTDTQYELFKNISNAKMFSFSAPTSMGKSFILKSFLHKVMQNKPPENIIIMVPTRALINQFVIDIKAELHNIIEQHNYKLLTNSTIVHDDNILNNYILVLTPERILSYISSLENPPIGFLFVDEAHKIGSHKDSRSITSYLAIEKLLKKNPNLNLYFASPNVSNPNIFLDMFGRGFMKNYKQIKEVSVNQNLFFLDLIEKYSLFFVDNNPSEKQYLNILSKINNINDFLYEITLNDNNLIYCNSKNKTILKAKGFFDFIKTKDIKPILSDKLKAKVKLSIAQIKLHIHKDYYLVDFLEYGIGYHFGNMPQVVRNIIEDLFREGALKYVFCTSTLLEGVNLPAKNVIILSNKKSLSKFEPIDFWNLAGRAGRFGIELSGNIFCIRDEENTWDNKEEVLIKNEIELKPTVNEKIDRNIRKIEKLLQDNDISGTKEEKKILKYIANMICIDTLDLKTTYKSPIIEKLIQNNKVQILKYAQEIIDKVEVPTVVLESNQTININSQNDVFKIIKFNLEKGNNIKLPSTIDFETTLKVLERLYNIYKWDENEEFNGGIKSMRYYALLATQWINGESLNQIINQSIKWNLENNATVKVDWQTYEVFNNSVDHINILINEIVENIERKLRFTFEKYFTHYYTILVELLGEDNAGVNWAQFIEYGTRSPIMIILQNLGLSRHTSNLIYSEYGDCIITDTNDKFKSIDKTRLLNIIDRNSIEYEEIKNIL